MTKEAQFREKLFTELSFGVCHLRPLRRLYEQLREDRLDADRSFHVLTGLHPNMVWYYAANPRTLAVFGDCLEESNLRRSLSIVSGDPGLLAACFIVVEKGLPAMEFHIDYGEQEIPAGVSSTMLTPLYAFEDHFGNLDYRDGSTKAEYRYRLGRAILFDGKFSHRTQSYRCDGRSERVLVSWSIASRKPRYRSAIRRVIESQSK